MVEPSSPTNPVPRRVDSHWIAVARYARFPRASWLLPLLLPLTLASGCGFVPKSRMTEAKRITQSLRAENDRLKDVALDLRTQNQDLSQRAVDDSRRIAVRDEAVERLEASVRAYQGERDTIVREFEAIKQRIRLSASTTERTAGTPATSALDRFDAFARTRDGWSFDSTSGILAVPPDRLFEPGTDVFKPGTGAILDALAHLGLDEFALEINGPIEPPPVHRAGFQEGTDSEASRRFLSAARAARLRDRLVAAGKLEPDRVKIAPAPRASNAADPGNTADRRVEIRLTPAPH